MANLAEQASKLLDFDQKLDITLLDSIVGCMYSGAGDQVIISLLHGEKLILHFLLDPFCYSNDWHAMC